MCEIVVLLTMNNLFKVFLFLVSNVVVYKVSQASLSYSRLGLDQHLHAPGGEQPLAKIAIHNSVIAIHESACIRANPTLLGLEV